MIDEQTTPAWAGPVELGVKPRAWAIFVDSGNARMWTTLQPHVQKLADANGLTVTPLYDQTALDAAVAAERERCARICDATPPYPFRPSIEAAHAIRNRKEVLPSDSK